MTASVLIASNKDIQILTGMGERYCRRELVKIRKENNLPEKAAVTYIEVAKYFRVPEEKVLQIINRIPVLKEQAY